MSCTPKSEPGNVQQKKSSRDIRPWWVGSKARLLSGDLITPWRTLNAFHALEFILGAGSMRKDLG